MKHLRLKLLILVAVLCGAAAALLLILTPKESPAVALTWEQLRNTTYPSELPRSRQAALQDGIYEEEVAPGSATRLRIQLADIIGFGKIDADDSIDAAAVLIGSPGGSGTFIYLVAVLNDDGQPAPVASELLGDRVAVRAIKVEDHQIVVSMRVRGATDPFALLTREVTRRYALQDGDIVLIDEATADVPSEPPSQFNFQPERLALEAGRSLRREGTLQPGGLITFVLPAKEGQLLSVTAASQFNNAILSIQSLDGSQILSRLEYANSWSGSLPATQDYSITVITLAGNDLKYQLSVELRPPPTPVPTPTTAPSPTPTPVRSSGGNRPSVPSVLKGSFRPAADQLATLSPPAASTIATRAQPAGVAVALPGSGVIYTQNGDTQFELASTVKVLIALAVMDAAQREGRYVDRFELSLLWPMITLSDNDSSTKLWDQIGGGRGIGSYLALIGESGVRPYDGPFWGTTTATPASLATILSRAVFGDLLNNEHRTLLLNLMTGVVPGQRWGITAGAEGETAATQGLVGLKNSDSPQLPRPYLCTRRPA